MSFKLIYPLLYLCFGENIVKKTHNWSQITRTCYITWWGGILFLNYDWQRVMLNYIINGDSA